jgi:delta8-fatty-acid desaturase
VSCHVPLFPKLPKKFSSASALPGYTMAEVAEHNTRDDCWIILDDRVYDITRFIDAHPGGVGPVVNMAGKDATDVFANYHAARVYKTMLPAYLIGACTDVVVYDHVADFRAARQEMLEDGLFETDMGYYAKLGAFICSWFVVSLLLTLDVVGGGSYTAHMVGAACMGIFWQQLAGVGHDLGHSGISHDFHLDHKAGSVMSAFLGLSLCWWKSDHNTHHVVCNAVEHDPNISHMPMIAITPKIFETTFYHTYHAKQIAMDFIARTLVSYQHWFFYPVMAVGRVNLYIMSLKYLLLEPDKAIYRKTELAALAVYFGWFLSLAFSLPTTQESLHWILVSHAVAGILHVQIVLSHWSMETYKGTPYTNKNTEWYLMQLRTTMNVATPEWLDYIHIGLQFQIEHHLFPRLPRHNLRKARAKVRAICKKHDIYYHEPGFFEGNLEMWRALRDTALEARKTTAGDGGFYTSGLYDGLMASG